MATDEGDPLVRAAAMSAFALKLPPFWPSRHVVRAGGSPVRYPWHLGGKDQV